MNLVVDANVVIKWFVAEPMYGEARLLLSRRLQLHAPDLVLAESINTLWKKARRDEVADPEPYLHDIFALSDIIDLRPMRDLVERAARIAFEVDHPIYDCLYLACAEFTESGLITADRRLADKAAKRLPGVRVHCIGTPGVADWLGAAATAPVIGRETVEALIAAHDAFEKTERFVLDALFGETEGPRILSAENQGLFLNSPSFRRLVDLILELSTDERIDLLALGWLGAGLFPDWQRSFAHAEEMVAELDPEYAAGHGDGWRTGYARIAGDECDLNG